jgi:hypothetical protein
MDRVRASSSRARSSHANNKYKRSLGLDITTPFLVLFIIATIGKQSQRLGDISSSFAEDRGLVIKGIFNADLI